MKRVYLYALILIMLILTGCSAPVKDEAVAEKYLLSQGYTITQSAGEISRYILQKDMLWESGTGESHQREWMVQEKEPDAYFGKEITVYDFTVIDHPLMDKYVDADSVSLKVMMSEGKVIGGYSFPNTQEQLYGGFYSLDGRTYEEITGKSLNDWAEEWAKKYG